jgi:hypothetical protein
VRGLIEILSRYKFTVEENTPLEQDIALDPELLGKVFENLLASYNEDTRTTARKALGAFYTPREVVSYMVDEALMAYLLSALEATIPKPASPFEPRLRQLFSSHPEHFQNPFTPTETNALIAAIDRVNILDPACGSGAFPMGALHRLVDLLKKLDPNNRHWKEQQLAKARRDRKLAEKMEDEENKQNTLREVESRIADIERSFDSRFHALDFARKLYLIENCIYGVDIQPIACQIAKLRFFIALIVDQHVDENEKNLGVRPLPNLETKIVAADSLIPIERRMTQGDMLTENVADVKKLEELRGRLEEVRHAYFNARTPESKRKCRDRDAKLRQEIAVVLERTGLEGPVAKAMAAWNPYDQNHAAPFFDSEWMFGLPVGKVRVTAKSSSTLLDSLVFINETRGQMEIPDNQGREIESGFNIVVANPPYVSASMMSKEQKQQLKDNYGDYFNGSADLLTYFYKRAFNLLKCGGTLSFISSNKFMRTGYGLPLRNLLASKAQLLQVIDFGELPVFGAGIDVAIIIANKPEKSSKHGEFIAAVVKDQNEIANVGKVVSERGCKFAAGDLSDDGWLLESKAVRGLLERIEKVGIPLGRVIEDRCFYGIKTGFNEAFILNRKDRDDLLASDRKLKDVLLPWLDGNEILRWRPTFSDQYVIAIASSGNKSWPWTECATQADAEKIFKKTYPSLFVHLDKWKAELKRRTDQGTYWWELRACSYWDEFRKPKIVFNETSKELHAFVDYEGLCINKTGFIIPSSENEFLTGVLTSQVLDYLYRHTFPTWGDPWKGGRVQFRRERMMEVPIPKATEAQKHSISLLVDYLGWLHKEVGSVEPQKGNPRDPLMLGYWEQVLNGLVYDLFFPEELHAAGVHLFKLVEQAALPAIDSIAKTKRLAELRTHFERLYDTTHSLRGALFTLRSLEPIRIIEGEK